MNVALSSQIRAEIDALTETGLYETAEALVTDALNTLFAARPDLRRTVAVKLYEKGSWSLGRAAEWSGLSIESFKEMLHREGVPRQTIEELDQLDEMAGRAALAAERPVS